MQSDKKALYLIIPVVIFLGLTFFLFQSAYEKTDGQFGYPLDDPYIHMAIAKNWITEGNWGVTKGEFTSSSSSPLWTLLISGMFWIGGVVDWLPFAANILIGVVLVIISYQVLAKYTSPALASLFTIVALLFTPLPILTLLGMEHTLHTLLNLIFMILATCLLAEPERTSHDLWKLVILAPILTMTRYEGFFAIFFLVSLFFYQKLFTQGLIILGSSLVPHLLYGLISLNHGWYFLPVSVLIKGSIPDLSPVGLLAFLQHFSAQMVETQHIFILNLVISVIFFLQHEKEQPPSQTHYLLATVIAISLLHLAFADTGWFYRYESYLVYAGIFVLGFALAQSGQAKVKEMFEQLSFSQRLILINIILLVLVPFFYRTQSAFNEYPNAVKNIYEQQYQTARFIQRYYPMKTVVANDIGAINYFGDATIIDVWGLGTYHFADLWITNQISPENLVRSINGYHPDLIIIYDFLLGGLEPEGWVWVGDWKITDRVSAGYDTVSFFVVSAELQNQVISQLQEFGPSLPEDVIQRGIYLEP